jgi:hypothetical protein
VKAAVSTLDAGRKDAGDTCRVEGVRVEHL